MLLLALPSGGCGSPGAAGGELARPDDPTAAEALGVEGVPGEGCTQVSPQAAPFLADWKTEQRASLESAMQDGVAILSYTCDGIKVLQDCKLRTGSEYSWAEIALKKENLEIDQSSDLRGTLPIAAATLSAEIKSGLKLRLAYAMIGKKPRKDDAGELPKDMLEGKPAGACDGATHYVRWAWIGAFDLDTVTEGSTAGSAKVMGAGAEAESSSAKKIGRTDGDIGACKPGSGESKPPAGCNAIVQLQLGPVVAKASAKAETGSPTEAAPQLAVNTCSQGYVKDAKGVCRTKATAGAYLCDPQDVQECVTQCEKGNGESCHNAAIGQYRKGVHSDSKQATEAARRYYEKGCEREYLPSCGRLAGMLGFGAEERTRSRELHQKACSGGVAESCMSLARGVESPLFTTEPSKFTPNHALAFSYVKKACDLGLSWGCSELAKRYIEGKGVLQNTDEGLKTLASSCQKKNISACLEWARFLVSGDSGATKDVAKGYAIYDDHCRRNVSSACVSAAAVLRKGNGAIKKNSEQAKKFLDHACNNLRNSSACAALGWMHEKGELGKADAATALSLYTKACPIVGPGGRDGCYEAASLYERGVAGTKKNPRLAADLYAKGCSSFDPDKTGVPEKSCRKAVTLTRQQKRTPELRRALLTLCGMYRDKQACEEQKKLGPPAPPPPPPKAPPPPPPKN